ncbi:MAG: 30S ribosomal protein S4 [Nanoarchaeota archaeon]|nr:30S ribosomal protein S4 [Nanoarchaeota archaeon]
MGLAIKHRKKFISHKKRWDKETITSEAELVRDYALKNKKEIKKVELKISKYKQLAKNLNTDESSKNSPAAQHLLSKFREMGILPSTSTTLDEVLDLKVRSVLERRLSNIVYKKKLARTPKQARQFVVHRHITIGGKCVNSPSHLVTLAEEMQVEFVENSALANEEHPERKLEVEGLKDELAKEAQRASQSKGGKEGDFDEREEVLDEEEQNEEGLK